LLVRNRFDRAHVGLAVSDRPGERIEPELALEGVVAES
jgi:hypothetical protein